MDLDEPVDDADAGEEEEDDALNSGLECSLYPSPVPDDVVDFPSWSVLIANTLYILVGLPSPPSAVSTPPSPTAASAALDAATASWLRPLEYSF